MAQKEASLALPPPPPPRDQKAAKGRRLSVWLAVNLLIGAACYLNYRLQLKHHYLYRTLNVGLCFSRAAAMVINFNLLLVWLPMCKYTLTRLASVACRAAQRQREQLESLASAIDQLPARCPAKQTADSLEEGRRPAANKAPLLDQLVKWPARRATLTLRHWLAATKFNSINSFLIALDNSTSLHTICATTITAASVVHTVAHLMNVINFSNNFDPLLGDLNMANFKGQNPLHLLVSVPGITGCFMVLILLLMSLSSTNLIRNSSFDLFQIFHRLSILFVLLLLLHPSSHVLKEQSNVDRHNPKYCYENMVSTLLPKSDNNSNARQAERPSVSTAAPPVSHAADYQKGAAQLNATSASAAQQAAAAKCLDLRPSFVAQSSICLYVLGVGLSCYLLDMLLRRFRRSKSSVELLRARTDFAEGNLVELTLSNNHKRFSHWKAGQFVYVNCPQIATFEWHPFTISSMDNRRREFTLHIRTGGDWTRKLRAELELDWRRPLFDCCAAAPEPASRAGGPRWPAAQFAARPLGPLAPAKLCRSYSLAAPPNGRLELFVDGPFHSPFERLLEQQVSVCVSNGVGWTAFSAVLQQIAELQDAAAAAAATAHGQPHVWWAKWRRYARQNCDQLPATQTESAATEKLSRITNLHLLVIVTTFEQLEPFYRLAASYFERFRQRAASGQPQQQQLGARNPVRELTVYVTQSNETDAQVGQFCCGEKLKVADNKIQVNQNFSIRFGRPNFELYLSDFGKTYADRRKISVYCCGSYQVRRIVRNICQTLSRAHDVAGAAAERKNKPIYLYHEENF